MKFYSKNSDQEYFSEFWAPQKKFLEDEGGELLTTDEANMHPFDDLIVKGSKGITETDAMKPRLSEDYHYFCIPYELGEEIKDSLEPETIITNLINDNLETPIFIASTDASFGCFAKCQCINEDIIWNFASPHLNTPFLIFNEKKEVFALIDYDLPLQIIGYQHSIVDKHNYIANQVSQSGWDTVFDRYASYINMPHLFDEYYRFLLPKEVVKALESMVIAPPNRPNQ